MLINNLTVVVIEINFLIEPHNPAAETGPFSLRICCTNSQIVIGGGGVGVQFLLKFLCKPPKLLKGC